MIVSDGIGATELVGDAGVTFARGAAAALAAALLSHRGADPSFTRATLEEAVRLMQIVGEGREGTPVRLSMSASGLDLSATAQERADAKEAIEAKFEGTDMSVAFNPQFLLPGSLYQPLYASDTLSITANGASSDVINVMQPRSTFTNSRCSLPLAIAPRSWRQSSHSLASLASDSMVLSFSLRLATAVCSARTSVARSTV